MIDRVILLSNSECIMIYLQLLLLMVKISRSSVAVPDSYGVAQ